MAHDFLFEKEENLSGKKAKVKVGQEGEQQQMNSDLKEYSRAICKRNNTVGRAGDNRYMVIWKNTAEQLNTVNIVGC